jgi:hypothetical protein
MRVHVAAALDQILASKARLEDGRGVGYDETLSPLQHVLGSELAGSLSDLLPVDA